MTRSVGDFGLLLIPSLGFTDISHMLEPATITGGLSMSIEKAASVFKIDFAVATDGCHQYRMLDHDPTKTKSMSFPSPTSGCTISVVVGFHDIHRNLLEQAKIIIRFVIEIVIDQTDTVDCAKPDEQSDAICVRR